MAHDKTGRQIEPGDMMKVFHFVGRNRKRHYLYQQALRYERGRLIISHMNRISDAEPWVRGKNFYCVGADERLGDYEIVQSVDAKWEERPTKAA